MTDASAKARPLRILQITRNLPPLRGGMERLNLYIALELAKEFEVAVVGPSGCRSELPKEIDVTEVPSKPLRRFFFGAFYAGVIQAHRFRPDIVLAGSGLTAPFAWLAARIAGASMVAYVHGLDLITDHPIYRWLWCPFIRHADRCIANSCNTARLAARIGIPESRIAVVHPGVESPEPKGRDNDFRERFNFGRRPLLLSVGRLIPRKGLLEFVANGLPLIAEQVPDICVVIIGDDAPDLLQRHGSGLRERIRGSAARLGLEDNVRFIGPQDDATLADAYRASDIHVFPVRDVPGDVEGFGMVAAEAAAHGLPTVAFAVGGVPDAVEDGVSGRLIAADDHAQFARAVIDIVNSRDTLELRDGARRFAVRFQRENFGRQIREQLRLGVRG